MTRTYYRLSLTALCALAAFVGPVLFLEDRFRTGYLLGGLGAAVLAWAALVLIAASETNLHPGLQGVLGMGAAVISWATISLVALFDVLPHVARHGFSHFDFVWIAGGLAPLVIPGVAWWRVRQGEAGGWQALLSALYRFSVPLFLVRLIARGLGLPKQYVWLFLFTGVMFLVLDGLGAGKDLPFKR